MDLKYLNTFKTIVREGSFSKAAEKLNYTQSTITFQMDQLERDLSAQLFEKVGRNMILTKAGENLIPYVDEVLDSVDKLHNFEEDMKKCSGDLKVGIAETQLCYKIPAVLKKFHEKAPNVRLFLRSMNCYDIRDEITEGTLDLGIFYEDVGGFGSAIATYPCGTYPLALVASADTKKRYHDFITPDRTIPVTFIINEKNCIFRQIFERYLNERAIKMSHTIELWSIPTIKNLVMNDMGVTFLPKFTVQRELDRGELREIPVALDNDEISAVCAHHKNKWISPSMRLFMDLVCCR